jgi:hypothetical protein
MSSRFVRYPQFAALTILIATALLICYGLLQSQIPVSRSVASQDPANKDIRLYEAIVKRLHNGESYYAVAGEELRSRGYATRPFINWRPPFLAWFLAALPTPAWGMWILSGVTCAACALWARLFFQAGNIWPAICIAFLLSIYIPPAFTENGLYLHEHWAGMIILLLLALYEKKHWLLAAIMGSAALLIRELSLPFVLVMFACALWERKWSEVVVWSLGLTVFASFLFIHAATVTPLILESDRTNSWMRFGGWSFVLATANMNTLLLLLPKGSVAVMLPLSLVGLAGWGGKMGLRISLSVATYIAIFFVIGRQGNTYWGLLYAPLLTFGLVFAPYALYDLWKAVPKKVTYD